ncbi:hypothetical protein YTPLAS18_16870 [Nitrospira sp.]|nr:hypothetical protein YTPLAS18_16870 [Nitrospira sp.]
MSDEARHRGSIYLHRGDLVQALAWYRKAEASDRAAHDPTALTETLGNLGNVLAMSGAYDDAVGCYRELLVIQRERQDQLAIAQTLINLGNIKKEVHEVEAARAYYLEALAMIQPLEEYRVLGALYANLGLLEANQGDGQKAIEHFHRALDCHRAVGDEDGLAMTYSQLGKTFLSLDQWLNAERCLNNASEHFIKLGNEPSEAAVLRVLADLYERRADRMTALRCLERVVQIGLRYRLPHLADDRARLAQLRGEHQAPPGAQV